MQASKASLLAITCSFACRWQSCEWYLALWRATCEQVRFAHL